MMKTFTRVRPVPGMGRVSKALVMGGVMALATGCTNATIAAENPPHITIRYEDLNLASASGVATLKHRIAHATEAVCGDLSTSVLRLSTQYRRCVKDASDRALAQVTWGK
ncbi:MAG TPA: UrcA family protein [Steroidobacteraceae bacterium]